MCADGCCACPADHFCPVEIFSFMLCSAEPRPPADTCSPPADHSCMMNLAVLALQTTLVPLRSSSSLTR